MKTQLALCTALLALQPLTGHAQTPPAAAPSVTLRLKFTPGEVLRYKMMMNMDMTMSMDGPTPTTPAAIPPMHEILEMDYNQTVQAVNPTDGSATLLQHITKMTGTLNGQPIPGIEAMADAYKDGFTVTMAPNGKMLAMQMPPSAAGKLPAGMDFSKFGNMMPTTLPSGPVRVGDSWSGDVDMNQMFGQIPGAPSLKMTLVSTLAGFDTGAQPAAEIHQTIAGTLGSTIPAGTAGSVKMKGQLNGASTMKFDISAGSIASQDGTFTANITTQLPQTPASSAASPQTMKMKMQMATHLTRLDSAPVAP